MLKKISLKASSFIVLSLLTGLLINSCKKVDHRYDMPIVYNNGANLIDTILVGETFTIHPQMSGRYNATYQWFLNEELVSTDSVFSFTPTTIGDYTVVYFVANPLGAKRIEYKIHARLLYEDGIFLINEGWFGNDKGSVNFYRYGTDSIAHKVFERENPGKELGTTTQYGTIFNERLYLVSQQGPLVVANPSTLKEVGRIESLPAGGRAFTGISNSAGLLSTTDGIYAVNLNTLSVGDKVSSVSGQVGSIRKEGNYVFAITESQGLVALDATNNYSVELEIPGMTHGLVKTANGHLWIAGGSSLFEIDPTSLDTTEIVLPFALANPWFAWNIGTVTASTTENAVYIGKTNSWGSEGTEVYKYVSGDENSLSTPFITLPSGKEFYGAGVQFNGLKNELVITAVQSGYGDNYSFNSLYFYDPSSATLKNTINYEYYYFPAMMVFN